MSTHNNTSFPKKTLTLKLDIKTAIPGQLQQQLEKIRESYLSKHSQDKAVDFPKKKSSVNTKGSDKADNNKVKKESDKKVIEQKKKEKATRHIKQQKEEQQQARKLRFEKMKQALAWLHERYPLCFNSYEPKPLKLHIEKDIFSQISGELPFPRLYLREAIKYYTKRPKYLDVLSIASHRYNLQGEAIEEVIRDHQQFASKKLTQYNEHKKEMTAAKKEKHKLWLEIKKKKESKSAKQTTDLEKV